MYTCKGRYVPKDEHCRLLQLGAPQPAITNPQGTLMAPNFAKIFPIPFSLSGGCLVLLIRDDSLLKTSQRERARSFSIFQKTHQLLSLQQTNDSRTHKSITKKRGKKYKNIDNNFSENALLSLWKCIPVNADCYVQSSQFFFVWVAMAKTLSPPARDRPGQVDHEHRQSVQCPSFHPKKTNHPEISVCSGLSFQQECPSTTSCNWNVVLGMRVGGILRRGIISSLRDITPTP